MARAIVFSNVFSEPPAPRFRVSSFSQFSIPAIYYNYYFRLTGDKGSPGTRYRPSCAITRLSMQRRYPCDKMAKLVIIIVDMRRDRWIESAQII